ncbi:m-phase inducer phosphatase [Stygiomarasmius scandens]|uniref:M-phase inducer phosphatase n=1 Tax=Marasmiellus scandens TaxID=2682957 RepID=A0ABR1JW56_9AGAR
MPFFTQSNSFLSIPSRSRARTETRRHDDVEEFLSSDLELSFASTVSLNSPSRDPVLLTPESDYAEPMDISPAPALKPTHGRPRAFTSAARLFGNDMSNRISPNAAIEPSPSFHVESTRSSSSKRTQRAALPTQWLFSAKQDTSNSSIEPSSPGDDDAMDVDSSSYIVEVSPDMHSFRAGAQSAAPTVTTFNNLFYDTMSPSGPSAPLGKKRRSHSPERIRLVEDDLSSSPAPPSSPSVSKLERKASASLLNGFGKPSLSGLGTPPQNAVKRPRRPALSAMVPPGDSPAMQSAYPVLTVNGNQPEAPKLPPVRRAFSAMVAPVPSALEQFSDESSFDGADFSSPAQAYAKRQQMKTIRRCDGTEDFRPLTGATAMVTNESSPSSKFFMPGFGDNEALGKILPCHRVTEDGLMRITPETMDDLLNGVYESKIHDYHVIDCRFDYEYSGGHISRAVNINTTAAVEELLLGPSLLKPKPSVSGDPAKKTVLIFHCEFSAKRGPTFAKHLRSKDRAMNNIVYPKVHYPELYILEGGYSAYFKRSPHSCEPRGYVSMDDPMHAASRRGDLDQFRKTKFGRHKSYAYGDPGAKNTLLSQQQMKRNSAPTSGPPTMFAAGNAARSRRGGSLMTLTEDGSHTADGDETDIDIGDSPCPPPTKAAASKSKKAGRAPLSRAETYGPARMPI